MKILLTGASGYIGSHLLPLLLEQGHHVWALVRHKKPSSLDTKFKDQLTWVEGNLLEKDSLPKLPSLDVAYYLVHSMADDAKNFTQLEEQSCRNFLSFIKPTNAQQIIYLSGLHQGSFLSKHFRSRQNVEQLLKTGPIPVTVMRASIIIGASSSSFTIIRDLVERLPIMIAPRWLNTLCQPIAISDVLYYLVQLLGKKETFNKTFEIGGPDIMTFKEMLLGYAKIRGLKRYILTIPVLTPRLSSYWLYLVTKVKFSLARSLVESLKVTSTVENKEIQRFFPHTCLPYEKAVKKALESAGS